MNRREKFYLFYISYAALGVIVAIDTLLTITDEGFSYPLGLALLGLSGMVLTALYKVLTTESPTFTTDEYSAEQPAILMVAMVLLALLGLVLQLTN